MPPVMHASTINVGLNVVSPTLSFSSKINNAGTENIIPADAPLTAEAMV